MYYKLIIPNSGNYCIETKSSYNTYFNLYDNNFIEIGSWSTYDDAGDNYNAKIYRYFSSGTYYVRMRMYSLSSEGRVNFIVYKSNQSIASNVYINGNYSYYISSSYIKPLKFTAPSNGTFHFYTSGTLNSYLTIYDNNMIFIGYNDNGIGLNASYYMYLEQGDVIYIFLRYYDPTTYGTTTFHIEWVVGGESWIRCIVKIN